MVDPAAPLIAQSSVPTHLVVICILLNPLRSQTASTIWFICYTLRFGQFRNGYSKREKRKLPILLMIKSYKTKIILR